MEIVFCYYDNINYDARAQEEIEALAILGRVHFVSYSKYENKKPEGIDYRITKKRSFLDFFILAKRTINEIRPDLVFLHDNYCAALIPFIRKKIKTKIVYDMSELYIGVENSDKSIKLKLYSNMLKYWEYKNIRNVDIAISANVQRGYISKGYFQLKKSPIVFDNVHRIDDSIDFPSCIEKYGKYYNTGKTTLLYAGGLGYPDDRDTQYVLNAINELDSNYQLIIAGKKSDKNPIFDNALKRNAELGLNNIHYVGMVPRSELRFLYRYSDINVVTFAQTTINNIYCASGKLYEGLFEGVPIVASENPPLIELCQKYNVGVVAFGHQYAEAIKTARENIDELKKNVAGYIASVDYDGRVLELSKEIMDNIE